MAVMQIALFGGSFDPPHLAHHQVVLEMLRQQLVDEVWYVPAKKHPFGKEMSSDDHRLKMVQLMLADEQGLTTEIKKLHHHIRIETYELDHPSISYSLNTLDYFSQTQPQHTFSWVIGSDNVASFAKWHHYQELLKKYQVWVYPRAHYAMEPLLKGMTPLKDMHKVDISSTEIRQRVRTGESIKGLVSPSVAEYLSLAGLYQK
jgi:nicotinate-nucleotide adenylyltransferase